MLKASIPYSQLSQQHPRFIYQSFNYQVKHQQLIIDWQFLLEPEIVFQPSLTIPLQAEEIERLAGQGAKPILDNLVFQLGLVELLSYWKSSCAPEIVIEAGALSADQIKWWHDLLIKGLGEFFYTNQIDFTADNFVTIKATDPHHSSPDDTQLDPKKIIVPLGGGKDSTVSLEVLKNLESHQLTPWSLNPIPASIATAQQAGFDNLRTSDRQIDPTLLELNQLGYLNGHTPFSAYLAFYYALVGWITQTKYIALSNEMSANECNVVYQGHEINHQYSKTFEFEQAFRQYSQAYLVKDLEYFSFLRPLHELQIAKTFTDFPAHFTSFRSCNRGQQTNTWCHDCPKCLFAFLMLYPFIDRETLTSQIFHRNLFESESLITTALDLVMQDSTKPFECVGSYEESKIAFYLAIKHYRQADQPLPAMLQIIWDQVLEQELNLDQRAIDLLNHWNPDNNLTPEFTNILQGFLH